MDKQSTDYHRLAASDVLSDQPYLQGIIFAVAACPEIPMPEQWMPWVIQADANSAIDKAQADQLADYLMACLRDTLDKMRQEQSLLPYEYNWQGEDDSSTEQQRWLQGVLTGHQQLEKQWLRAWQDSEHTLDLNDLSSRLTRCLKVFSTLADPAARLQQTAPDRQAELHAGLPRLAASLPALLNEYVEISGELVQVLPNQFEVVPKDT